MGVCVCFKKTVLCFTNQEVHLVDSEEDSNPGRPPGQEGRCARAADGPVTAGTLSTPARAQVACRSPQHFPGRLQHVSSEPLAVSPSSEYPCQHEPWWASLMPGVAVPGLPKPELCCHCELQRSKEKPSLVQGPGSGYPGQWWWCWASPAPALHFAYPALGHSSPAPFRQ